MNRYYDVIGAGKEPGFLKVERGGKVKVGAGGKSKLVIGRMTSGWVEARGRLEVTSTLEIGDTKGTTARLTVEGGDVTAPKLITGDCDWELSIRGNGKLRISGESIFGKGQGKIDLTGGGLFRTGKVQGIPRSGVTINIAGGGKIQVEGAGAESLLRGWIDGGKVQSPAPLEVKKITEKKKTFFQISTK